MRETTRILADAGVTQKDIAREAGFSMARGPSGGACSGSNLVSNMLAGRARVTARADAAIRALLPGQAADRLLRLAAESLEARRG